MSQKVLKLFFVTPRSLKLNWNKLAALRKMLKLMATPQFREKPFHRTIIIHIVFNVVNNLRRSFHRRHFLKRNSCPLWITLLITTSPQALAALASPASTEKKFHFRFPVSKFSRFHALVFNQQSPAPLALIPTMPQSSADDGRGAPSMVN